MNPSTHPHTTNIKCTHHARIHACHDVHRHTLSNQLPTAITTYPCPSAPYRVAYGAPSAPYRVACGAVGASLRAALVCALPWRHLKWCVIIGAFHRGISHAAHPVMPPCGPPVLPTAMAARAGQRRVLLRAISITHSHIRNSHTPA